MDVMFDLETFGTSGNAAIVQLGAVVFDRVTGEIHPIQFISNVDLNSCLAAGLEMDASTVLWWMKQGEEARKSILDPPGTALKSVLEDFNDWLGMVAKRLGAEPKSSITMWSHATFDFPILQNAFSKMGIKPAFSFKGARDLRTLTDLAGIEYWTPEYEKAHPRVGLVHHNALDDCLFQVEYAVEALRKVSGDSLRDSLRV
jgi:DNA polymerase III epsilon subunit-like protein